MEEYWGSQAFGRSLVPVSFRHVDNSQVWAESKSTGRLVHMTAIILSPMIGQPDA